MAKLRTQEVEKLLKDFPLYSQDGKGAEALVLCKFFIGSITWYITEGSQEGEDFTLFGLTCNGEEAEFGYVSLNELDGVELRVNIKDRRQKGEESFITLEVERDLHFQPITLKELAGTDETVRRHLLLLEYIKE